MPDTWNEAEDIAITAEPWPITITAAATSPFSRSARGSLMSAFVRPVDDA